MKKILCLLLSLTMVLTMFAVPAFATETESAVEVLSALNILEGRGNGDFALNSKVTRAEMAAIICRAKNAENNAIATTDFSDVAADHWAAGYIGWAAAEKIVNGRGNGTFDPDADVTINEAIKMIICAMGYEWYVENKLGGYPTGYARIAGAYKIDADVNGNYDVAATRGEIASLIYNALDEPLMDYAPYISTTEQEYIIYNGNKSADYEKRTLLSYYFDTYKVKAVVNETYRNDSSLITSKGDKLMSIGLQNFYGFSAEDIQDALKFNNGVMNGTNDAKVIANNDSWAKYQGHIVDVYLTLNKNDKVEVVAIVPSEYSNDKIEILNAKELVVESSIDGDNIVFEYYEDIEDARTKDADIDSEFVLYENNVVSTQDKFERIDDGDYSTVTLLDSNDDGAYDKIYVTKYEYAIVEDVDVDYEIIETKDNGDYYLSADDTSDEFVYNIYKDGNKIALEDLAEGDLLNIIVGGDSVEDATFVDIYVTNNIIESKITSKRGDNEYTIDGKVYYGVDGLTLKPGDAGSFYITIDGYLFDADLTSAYSDNYGFILDIAETNNAFGTSWEIKLLDKNNKVRIIPVRSTVRIDGENYKAKDNYAGELDAIYDMIHVGASDDHNVDSRFVTFGVIANEISEINFPGYDDFNCETLRVDSHYSPRTDMLGGYEVTDATYIFNVPVDNSDLVIEDGNGKYMLDENLIQVYSVYNLDEDTDYNGYVYNIDRNGFAGAALLTHNPGFAGNINALAVIESIAEGLNDEGERAKVVTFWQGTEKKTLVVTNDVFIGTNIFEAGATAGDVFQYTLNANDEINGVKLVFDYSEATLETTSAPGDITYAAGVVTNISNKLLELDGEGYAWDEIDTNVLMDTTRTNAKFRGYNGTSYIKAARVTEGVYTTDAYFVVVKLEDDAIVDIVAYKVAEEDMNH